MTLAAAWVAMVSALTMFATSTMSGARSRRLRSVISASVKWGVGSVPLLRLSAPFLLVRFAPPGPIVVAGLTAAPFQTADQTMSSSDRVVGAMGPPLLDCTHGRVQYEISVRFSTRRSDMGRKVADCRDFPSDSECTLTIAGAEEEVLDAATQHAVAKHGHDDTTELRDMLRGALKDEISA